MHTVTTIYWDEKLYGPPKKGSHTSNNFTDKNQFRPRIQNIADVGMQ